MARSKRTAAVCQACQATVLAEDIPAHNADPDHLARVGPWRIKATVEKVMGWKCPGRPFAAMLPSGR